jgi:hypothetical protein
MNPSFLFIPPFFYLKAWFVFWLMDLIYQLTIYVIGRKAEKAQ